MANESGRTLIATWRFRFVSVARYTSPYSWAAGPDGGLDLVWPEMGTRAERHSSWLLVHRLVSSLCYSQDVAHVSAAAWGVVH